MNEKLDKNIQLQLKKIGEEIKTTRENYNLSLKEMALLLKQDHSDLSKIEKGQLNIKLEQLLSIFSLLELKIVGHSPNKKIKENYDFIVNNLGKIPIKDIAAQINIDRTNLKKYLLFFVKIGKIDKDSLAIIKPTAKKYEMDHKAIDELKIGGIYNLKCENKNSIVYHRSFLTSLKEKGKEFLTKLEPDFILIIVRIK